jgi:hypothetical protein
MGREQTFTVSVGRFAEPKQRPSIRIARTGTATRVLVLGFGRSEFEY